MMSPTKKAILAVALTSAVCAGLIFSVKDAPPFGYKSPHPKFSSANGFVPDKKTAIQFAVAAWTPIYGKESIGDPSKYDAVLKDGVWYVEQHLPPTTLGGSLIAEIAQRDGRILNVAAYQ